jgi:hypothetical protein
MSTFLVPALEAANALLPPLTLGEAGPHDGEGLSVPESPFHRLTTLSRSELVATREVPAAERRLLMEHFVATFQWETIQSFLPLRLAVPPGVPPWRPRRCRSYYRWLLPNDLQSTDDWSGWDDFDLVLRLFDFSPWRPILAQRFASHYGPQICPVSPPFAWRWAKLT